MRKKRRIRRILAGVIILAALTTMAMLTKKAVVDKRQEEVMKRERKAMEAMIGENRPITDGDFDPDLAVECSNGTFVGQEREGVCAFKGIPYAKPPVGELRWKRPVPAPGRKGVYEAYYFGKSGIQTEAETERASFYTQGEDCLTLNIWTSGLNKTKSAAGSVGQGKPVMVFLPGGAYGWGGSADPLYDGHNFAKAQQDVILVTVNYRIGLMGFMDFSAVPGGEAFQESGNLGLLDQICALKWVQRNIRGFGGDPENVTVFGESAGGGSVSLLPLIDEAKGLFRRVIAESGSIALTYSRSEAQDLTRKLLKKTKARSMDDLMALSEEELMQVNQSLNDYNNFPERDGVILPEDLYAAYEAGKGSGVDMMIGTNKDEMRYWIGEMGGYPIYRIVATLLYKTKLYQLPEEHRALVKQFMKLQNDKNVWNITELMNEWIFRVPAAVQAAAHAVHGGNTYMYYWTRESAIPHYGACHAVELAYVFGNVDETIFTGKRADAALSAQVQQMWVNFAKTGNPGTEEHPWEEYEPSRRKTMLIGDTIRQVSDPKRAQRELIEPLLSCRFNGYYGLEDQILAAAGRNLRKGLLLFVSAEILVAAVWYGVKWKKSGRHRR